MLRDGESNPGLPRDRRGYSPLYYRGDTYLHFCSIYQLATNPKYQTIFDIFIVRKGIVSDKQNVIKTSITTDIFKQRSSRVEINP